MKNNKRNYYILKTSNIDVQCPGNGLISRHFKTRGECKMYCKYLQVKNYLKMCMRSLGKGEKDI